MNLFTGGGRYILIYSHRSVKTYLLIYPRETSTHAFFLLYNNKASLQLKNTHQIFSPRLSLTLYLDAVHYRKSLLGWD